MEKKFIHEKVIKNKPSVAMHRAQNLEIIMVGLHICKIQEEF